MKNRSKKSILKSIAYILVISLNLTVLQPLAVFAEQNISSVETMQEKWVPSEEDKRTVPLSLQYVNYGYDLVISSEETKHTINKTEVIIRKKTDGDYRGKFEKNGFYYTFETSNINEEKMLSALKEIIG